MIIENIKQLVFSLFMVTLARWRDTSGNKRLQFQSTKDKRSCLLNIISRHVWKKKKIWSDFYHPQLPLSGNKEQYGIFMFLECMCVCNFKEFNSNDNSKWKCAALLFSYSSGLHIYNDNKER